MTATRTTLRTTTTVRSFAASTAQRAVAFGLAVGVSMALLAGVSMTADHAHDQAQLAQAEAQFPVQVVVITAPRLPGA